MATRNQMNNVLYCLYDLKLCVADVCVCVCAQSFTFSVYFFWSKTRGLEYIYFHVQTTQKHTIEKYTKTDNIHTTFRFSFSRCQKENANTTLFACLSAK